jgi:serine/threonine protein kinase
MSTVFKPDETRYVLERKLGEGLNSNVWRATRVDFSGENSRTTALKLPKDQTSVPFLRREYEILHRVNSLNVARVIAWESFGGEPALALEWIDGVTLYELTQSQTLTTRERDELIRQIHAGLADVEKSGASHGDLHPGNIMINRDGRAILIDFASGKTAEGFLQATPAFVSPELWKGANFSYESDLFALKVIREHMLTGFRDLPKRTTAAKDFKVTKDDGAARKTIGHKVGTLLARTPSNGTQLLEIDELSAPPMKKKFAIRVACLAALVLTLHIPVFAEDPPPDAPGAATITVTSRKWMQIQLNGDEAGYAPIQLTHLKSGIQHLKWKSATGQGEFRFKMQAGDTVRLVENGGGQLVRKVH